MEVALAIFQPMYTRSKLVLGIGRNDYPEQVYRNGVRLRAYTDWCNMLRRCYSPKYLKRFPTYADCTVCDEWLSFSAFKSWHDANYQEGFVLDKDILVQGNKTYGPDACRFVPPYLNIILITGAARRGRLPLGVTSEGNRLNLHFPYLAQCHNGYRKQLRAAFRTLDEAQSWYRDTKKRIIKEQATRAFLDNAIKSDVYLALVRRVIE